MLKKSHKLTEQDDIDADSLIARLESVPFSRWHAKARVIVGSATFFDAFSALSLAFALPVLVPLWHITPQQSGILIGSSYVGQLIGALLFSALAEKFGRVRSAAGATAIMSVMSVACVYASNFPMLLTYRFIQGIGIGGEMPVAAAYISELSKAKGRGRFFLLYEMIFPIGLMATGQVGAWVVPTFGWQTIFWIGGIPGLIVTLLMMTLPESPRWLISKNRLAEADAVIKEMEASTKRRVHDHAPACRLRLGRRRKSAPVAIGAANNPANKKAESISNPCDDDNSVVRVHRVPTPFKGRRNPIAQIGRAHV